MTGRARVNRVYGGWCKNGHRKRRTLVTGTGDDGRRISRCPVCSLEFREYGGFLDWAGATMTAESEPLTREKFMEVMRHV